MATGYVITEIGYEYNDEIYSQNDSGGGTPIRVFLDKEKAQAEVNRMNIDSLISCEIGSYAYDLEEIIDDIPAFEKIISKYDLKKEVNMKESYDLGKWFASNASKFSESDKVKLLDLVMLEFFSITEVEIDDSILPPKEEKTSKKFSNL